MVDDPPVWVSNLHRGGQQTMKHAACEAPQPGKTPLRRVGMLVTINSGDRHPQGENDKLLAIGRISGPKCIGRGQTVVLLETRLWVGLYTAESRCTSVESWCIST